MDDENSEYLNFNYTYTLEKLYNIKKVNHIHIEDKIGRDYIFGHKKKYKKNQVFLRILIQFLIMQKYLQNL